MLITSGSGRLIPQPVMAERRIVVFPDTKHLRSDFWSVENSSASAQQTRVTTPGCFFSRAKWFVVRVKAVFTFTHVSYTTRKILFLCRDEFLELYAEDGYNC